MQLEEHKMAREVKLPDAIEDADAEGATAEVASGVEAAGDLARGLHTTDGGVEGGASGGGREDGAGGGSGSAAAGERSMASREAALRARLREVGDWCAKQTAACLAMETQVRQRTSPPRASPASVITASSDRTLDAAGSLHY